MPYRIKNNNKRESSGVGAHSRDAPRLLRVIASFAVLAPEEAHVRDFSNNSSLTLCDLPNGKPGKPQIDLDISQLLCLGHITI